MSDRLASFISSKRMKRLKGDVLCVRQLDYGSRLVSDGGMYDDIINGNNKKDGVLLVVIAAKGT
eukprot:scaffold431942_cov25-Prasinocladus_malaysianus.AAC.1